MGKSAPDADTDQFICTAGKTEPVALPDKARSTFIKSTGFSASSVPDAITDYPKMSI
jgi:hypothetical protein